MSDILVSYGIATYVSRNVLIVPFQADFYDEVLQALQTDVLQQLHSHPDIQGLVIDVSKCRIIDKVNMQSLEAIFSMASILGVQTYLTGIQPQVTLALIELGYEPAGHFNTALTLESATQAILHHAHIKSEGIAEGVGDEFSIRLDERELMSQTIGVTNDDE